MAAGQTIASATAGSNGEFTLSDISLSLGTNTFLARTSDAAGNTTELPVSLIRDACVFDAGLTGWTTSQHGGSQGGQGSVTGQGCRALLVEGDSFLVALSRPLSIPATPSVLEFSFQGLSFDSTDPDFVKDAFEVALLDEQGFSLVPTFLPARDALLNFTEGLVVATGSGTRVDGNRVMVSLAGVHPGTATLVFRLANDDSDTRSQVSIDDAVVRPATPDELAELAPPVPVVAAADGESPAAIDFALFSDITASFSDLYFRTSFDERRICCLSNCRPATTAPVRHERRCWWRSETSATPRCTSGMPTD